MSSRIAGTCLSLAVALGLALSSASPADARGYRHHHHGGGGFGPGLALGLGVGLVAPLLFAPRVYYPPPPVTYYAPPPPAYYAPPAAYGGLDAVPTSPAFVGPGGAYCREFQSTAVVGGFRQPLYGTACQQPDGSWRVVR